MITFKKETFFLLIVQIVQTLLATSVIFAQAHISSASHRSSVNVIKNINDEMSLNKSYFTAGKDGFLIRWSDNNEGAHYQISDLEIKCIAIAPNKNDIAVYETNGGLINRVSVWDWANLKRKYARRFKDSIMSLDFSARGTYLIIGTATIDGVVFLRSDTGAPINKLSDNTGVVTMIQTSATEKTAVFYCPTGSISYYNLSTGKLKQKITTENNLDQVTMFNNSMFLAGVKGSTIYVMSAVTGKTLATFSASKPLFLGGTKPTDSILYYLQDDEKGGYTLEMLEAKSNTQVNEPKLIKEYYGPRGSKAITCGTRNSSDIILGGGDGTIYQTDMVSYGNADPLNAVTENTYEKILDVQPFGDGFCFLTEESVFHSTYEDGDVEIIATNNNGYNSVLPYGDRVILYEKDGRVPVILTGSSGIQELFTPKSSLQSLKLNGNNLIEMESGSTVNIFDMDTKTLKEVYNGSGLQDAIVSYEQQPNSNMSLYISKSASTPPNSTLLKIDTKTLETVPINFGGNVVFALNNYQNELFGISIQVDNNTKNTVVFRYNPLQKRKSTILRIADEDNGAFTYLSYPFLYTNIGKDSIRSYNILRNQNTVYKRSSSIPYKVCQNSNKTAILNNDGSVAWYTPDNQKPLAVWYYTKDGQWYEF